MSKIHPTAIVDETTILGEGVEVGPYAILERDVTIGDGTIIRPHAVVRQYTTLGKGNYVDTGVVLGGLPQDYKAKESEESYLRIGDNNVFREQVTINRATGEGEATVVGNGTMWMACSHAGHNATVGDGVVLPNGSLLAGHTTVEEYSILPAAGGVHQFCWIGEKCMLQACALMTMHMPPFCIAAGVNTVIGLNRVGLQRDERFTREDRMQIKEAFQMTYRAGVSASKAVEAMDACSDWGDAAGRFRDFVRSVVEAAPPFKRGLCPNRRRRG